MVTTSVSYKTWIILQPRPITANNLRLRNEILVKIARDSCHDVSMETTLCWSYRRRQLIRSSAVTRRCLSCTAPFCSTLQGCIAVLNAVGRARQDTEAAPVSSSRSGRWRLTACGRSAHHPTVIEMCQETRAGGWSGPRTSATNCNCHLVVGGGRMSSTPWEYRVSKEKRIAMEWRFNPEPPTWHVPQRFENIYRYKKCSVTIRSNIKCNYVTYSK